MRSSWTMRPRPPPPTCVSPEPRASHVRSRPSIADRTCRQVRRLLAATAPQRASYSAYASALG